LPPCGSTNFQVRNGRRRTSVFVCFREKKRNKRIPPGTFVFLGSFFIFTYIYGGSRLLLFCFLQNKRIPPEKHRENVSNQHRKDGRRPASDVCDKTTRNDYPSRWDSTYARTHAGANSPKNAHLIREFKFSPGQGSRWQWEALGSREAEAVDGGMTPRRLGIFGF